MIKYAVYKYFDTFVERKFYFDTEEEAKQFAKEKNHKNTRYKTSYDYRGEVEVPEK